MRGPPGAGPAGALRGLPERLRELHLARLVVADAAAEIAPVSAGEDPRASSGPSCARGAPAAYAGAAGARRSSAPTCARYSGEVAQRSP